MDENGKFWATFWIVLFTFLLGFSIVCHLDNVDERNTKQQKFEAAAKAGLVQRVDPVTSKVIWVKPNE